MIKEFIFEVELTNGKTVVRTVLSKHINGAVRKIYQTDDVERIVRIM